MELGKRGLEMVVDEGLEEMAGQYHEDQKCGLCQGLLLRQLISSSKSGG
jgi:hypothetical protein